MMRCGAIVERRRGGSKFARHCTGAAIGGDGPKSILCVQHQRKHREWTTRNFRISKETVSSALLGVMSV